LIEIFPVYRKASVTAWQVCHLVNEQSVWLASSIGQVASCFYLLTHTEGQRFNSWSRRLDSGYHPFGVGWNE